MYLRCWDLTCGAGGEFNNSRHDSENLKCEVALVRLCSADCCSFPIRYCLGNECELGPVSTCLLLFLLHTPVQAVTSSLGWAPVITATWINTWIIPMCVWSVEICFPPSAQHHLIMHVVARPPPPQDLTSDFMRSWNVTYFNLKVKTW